MPAIVYQGLQSCFESQLIETTTLKLKVGASAASSMELSSRGLSMVGYGEIKEKYYYQDNNVRNKKSSSNLDVGGWTFLQSLSNAPKDVNERQPQSSYVHPLCKRSPRLSQKSLELCTENLGSETGSDTMEISILSSPNPTNTANSSSLSSSSMEEEEQPKLRQQMELKSKVVSRNFPPPLTTIRSSNSLQVRPRREDGRLIIQAVETPSRNTFLRAERSNGRLRLSFFNDSAAHSFNSDSENECDNIEEDNINEYESDINDDEDNYYQEDDQLEEYDVIDNMDAEVDIGMENKFHQRPSRCNEDGHGNKGLCNWKPLWVATS